MRRQHALLVIVTATLLVWTISLSHQGTFVGFERYPALQQLDRDMPAMSAVQRARPILWPNVSAMQELDDVEPLGGEILGMQQPAGDLTSWSRAPDCPLLNFSSFATLLADRRHDEGPRSTRGFVWPSPPAARSFDGKTPAKPGIIIDALVVQSNFGTLDFAVNHVMWLQRSAPQLFDRLQLFCEDHATYKRMYQLIGDRAVRSPHVDRNGAIAHVLQFDTPDFLRLVVDRYSYILSLLEAGKTVLFADVDVITLRDYEPYFARLLKETDYDIFAQQDSAEQMCMGFVLYRKSDRAVQFVKQLVSFQVYFRAHFNDQIVANEMLKYHKEFMRTGLLLDENLFASGLTVWGDIGDISPISSWWQNNRDKTLVIHNNFAVGHTSKLYRFRKLNLFLPEREFTISLAVRELSAELWSCLESLNRAEFRGQTVHLRLLVTSEQASMPAAPEKLLRASVRWSHGLLDIVLVQNDPLNFASEHWRLGLIPLEVTRASWGLFVGRPVVFEPCFFLALYAFANDPRTAARSNYMGVLVLTENYHRTRFHEESSRAASDDDIIAVMPNAAMWTKFHLARQPSLVRWMARQRLSFLHPLRVPRHVHSAQQACPVDQAYHACACSFPDEPANDDHDADRG